MRVLLFRALKKRLPDMLKMEQLPAGVTYVCVCVCVFIDGVCSPKTVAENVSQKVNVFKF